MNNIVFAKLEKHKHCNTIHVYCSNDTMNIDVLLTVKPEEGAENELVLLSALTILEPFCRCGETFVLTTPFNTDELSCSLNSTKMFLGLPWVKSNIVFKQEDFKTKKNGYFFSTRNSIDISDEKLAQKYSIEINKTLPFAIYERKRCECDYAWRCSECPDGIDGKCDAILYEEYALLN